MTSSAIEALYIFNHNNEPLLDHVYRSRPASSRTVLPLYLAQPVPRRSLIYLPNINPPTSLFSLVHANLVFLVPSSTETEPLFVLEFLHRLVDVLEEFLGTPLAASKIETSYDVVAQLLGEMCDAGNVCNTEANALRDVVNMPGWVDKLLGDIGLPGSAPVLSNSSALRSQLVLKPANAGPAIPWRRANVRHTSNELYVDIVETLSVTLAPSGRPLAAFAYGSILFNSKLSGVPDLLLNLTAPSGRHTLDKIMELPTFHPCVRLSRWKENPGELSFVPPDGKFVLAGYEVNLLSSMNLKSLNTKTLNLPVLVEVLTSLGTQGAEFEARLILDPPSPSSTSASRPGGSGARSTSGISTPSFFGTSASATPSLRDVIVTIPIPEDVRNLTDLRASRGEATFSPVEHLVEWRMSTKDAASPGNLTLRCTVVGPLGSNEDDTAPGFGFDQVSSDYSYDETEGETMYQSGSSGQQTSKPASTKQGQGERDAKKIAANRALMPSWAAVSFSVKGWLASGIKVESLNIDTRKSRGLGEGVRPVKGAKYLTVSRKGVETRC